MYACRLNVAISLMLEEMFTHLTEAWPSLISKTKLITVYHKLKQIDMFKIKALSHELFSPQMD